MGGGLLPRAQTDGVLGWRGEGLGRGGVGGHHRVLAGHPEWAGQAVGGGGAVRGRKEEAKGRGGWAAGDGVGVGAGDLEPLWPQPLRFSRFRFVNSCRLRGAGWACPFCGLCPGKPRSQELQMLKPWIWGPQEAHSPVSLCLGGWVLGAQFWAVPTCGH